MRLLLAASLLSALVACAAPQPEPVVALSDPNAQAADMECHQEAPAGSNVIHRVCNRRQTQAERDAFQQSLQRNPGLSEVEHPAAGPGH